MSGCPTPVWLPLSPLHNNQEGRAMNTEFMLLAIYNKPRLNLKEVCSAIGMSLKTGYNKHSAHTFPIPMAGDPLMADIRDVAVHLDALREGKGSTKTGAS